MITPSRRGFLSFLGTGLIAAPSIVPTATATVVAGPLERISSVVGPRLRKGAVLSEAVTDTSFLIEYRRQAWANWARNAVLADRFESRTI